MKAISKIIKTLLGLTGLVVLTSGVLSDNGKAGRTGSPGESNCHSCHDAYTLNSGGGSVALTSANMTGWQYVPGTTYHMTCTVARAGMGLYGLGLEALTSTNANAGTLVISDAASTQIKNATVQNVQRRNVVHKLDGGQASGAKNFNFDWQAPATDIGNVTFYFAGVAANGDGHEDIGDYVYTGSQVITPAATTAIEESSSADEVLSVYPNPVLDVLNLSYQLQESGLVQVDLFDQRGRLVQRLLSAHRQPGRQVEMLNGLATLPAGAYILRTNIAGVQDARTVVLRGSLDQGLSKRGERLRPLRVGGAVLNGIVAKSGQVAGVHHAEHVGVACVRAGLDRDRQPCRIPYRPERKAHLVQSVAPWYRRSRIELARKTEQRIAAAAEDGEPVVHCLPAAFDRSDELQPFQPAQAGGEDEEGQQQEGEVHHGRHVHAHRWRCGTAPAAWRRGGEGLGHGGDVSTPTTGDHASSVSGAGPSRRRTLHVQGGNKKAQLERGLLECCV